jgi:hypothetical protein
MANLRQSVRCDTIPGPAPEAGACARSIAALQSHAVPAAADRYLLFAVLALQKGLVAQGALVAAFQAWTRDKPRSLADQLVARDEVDADADIDTGLEPPLFHPSS